MNILILDDMQNIVKLIGEVCRVHGHETHEFTDIVTAQDYFARTACIDMIIVDYQLMREDFNGLDVIRYVKARRDIPCILITGSLSADAINNLEPIADMTIDKVLMGFKLEELFNKLQCQQT